MIAAASPRARELSAAIVAVLSVLAVGFVSGVAALWTALPARANGGPEPAWRSGPSPVSAGGDERQALAALQEAAGLLAARLARPGDRASGRIAAARPFVLAAEGAEDPQQALNCLTAAIYYEAALEPTQGQEAVAQVVVNRLRDPRFPKSVCGVVLQGAERTTGCQFTFTCDGSLQRPPARWAWARAQAVAERALSGSVMPQVGEATHYHARWMTPYWSAFLPRIAQIGGHIFYR